MLKSTIKRLIAVLLAVFMLILCTTGAYAAETPTEDEQPTHSPIYFGDITDDADNKPTIKDATLIQQYVADIKTLQNIRTYAFTKDGTLMTQKELINYLCDVNKDGEVNVVDATDIQRYLAGLDVKNTNLGKIAFEWRDAEYRNGKAYTGTEILNHLCYHTNTNQLPVTREGYLARYYVDAYGQKRPVGPGYSVWVTFKDENGNLYSKDMPYDESLPLYNGNGSHGSYRYTYTTNIPTGEYEEIEVPARVPVYTSGEAYVATATGEVLYHADGVAWTPSEFGWFIERREQEGINNGLSGQELIAYTGRIEKQWTDKIPTGQFTDTPLEGCYHYETVHHDAVTHTEEITDYDAEPIDKKLIKPEGYYAVQ